MRPGKLTVICGPMFAGKSTELVSRVHEQTLVMKPAMDSRYGREVMSTHDGKQVPAWPVRAWPEWAWERSSIVIDEIQFFDTPWFDDDLTDIISRLLKRDVDIVVAGLDMDAWGRPFEVTATLCALADEVIKLKARCATCGQPAGMTLAKRNAGQRVLLGGAESYEPACRLHWSVPE